MEVLGEKHRAECFDLGAEDGRLPRWRRALFPKDTQEEEFHPYASNVHTKECSLSSNNCGYVGLKSLRYLNPYTL